MGRELWWRVTSQTMNNTARQIRVVCSDDPPRPVAARYKPGKNSVPWRFRASVRIQFTIDHPLQVNQYKAVCQGAQAIVSGRPNAPSQLR